MKLLTLGRIIRTKGLDGTFKVNSSTDFALERYEEGNKVFIQNEKTKELKEVTVRRYYFDQGFDYVAFEEIPTIDEATPYINSLIMIDKDTLPPLEEDEYYFDDLEGCKVNVKGNHIGKVSKVEDYNGRRSLRVTLSNRKQILIPFVDQFIKDVNIEKKTIEVELIEGMIE